MEIQQVRYFLALASTRSFTRAAELSNVTQPALTKAIQKLEYEFGGELIHRERRNTHLTELGQRVLPMLRQAMICTDAARDVARDLRRQTLAPLRIALAPTVSASLLSGPLAALARTLPGLQVDLMEANGAAASEALMQGDIHAAIGALVDPIAGRIDRWVLFEERYLAVAHHTHAFAAVDVVPLDLVREAVWLERPGCEIAGALRGACFTPGEGPRIGHRATQEAHLQQMALAGLGVFLAPEHITLPPDLVARPIEGDVFRRSVGLHVVAGRRYSPALDAFIRISRRWPWATMADATSHDRSTSMRPALRAVS